MSPLAAQEHRLRALREGLETAGLAGAVISRPEHILYFAGVEPGPTPAYLVVGPQSLTAVAPAALAGCQTVTYTAYDIHHGWSIAQGAAQALAQALAKSGLRGRPTGVELAHLTANAMAAAAPQIGEPRDIADLLWGLRRIKDAGEIAQIEANVAANDRMFAAVRAAIRPGLPELELWAVIYRAMCEAAGGPITLEADLGVGARGVNPDAKPGPHSLAAGDTVFVDVYSAAHGYYADTTRVFTAGRSSARQREVHEVLAQALAAGEAQLRPGVAACAVDAAVRAAIERAGFGPSFAHHSGHAYGLFQQERPYLIPAEPMPLEEGMVVTLEPGIYIAGWGGMRLEGNWLITASGARRLDRFPSELIECL